MSEIFEQVRLLCQRARAAAPSIATADCERRNRALSLMAEGLLADCETILAANRRDLDNAAENGVPVPSLAFFHIPLKKYDEAFETKYAYEFKKDFTADRTEDGDFGVICEHNANRIDPDHAFYNMARSVGTVGFFAGHEHKNDACIHYDGTVLAYGIKTGVAAYYRDDAIGGTLIEVNPDGTFTVTPHTCRKRLEIAMC